MKEGEAPLTPQSRRRYGRRRNGGMTPAEILATARAAEEAGCERGLGGSRSRRAAAAYPMFEVAGETLAVYARLLADLEPRHVEAAIEQHICGPRFFPTVAELREIAVALRRRKAAELEQRPARDDRLLEAPRPRGEEWEQIKAAFPWLRMPAPPADSRELQEARVEASRRELERLAEADQR